MTLTETIIAAGMTPPNDLIPGRFLRFPGCGKGRSNSAGWCRIISPTLAIYGDWSTGLSEVWRDDSHRDDANSRRQLAEARRREREYVAQQRRRQAQAANEATLAIKQAAQATHPYLARKGFPDELGLVRDDKLLIPMRDAIAYRDIISVQEIAPDGTKRFLTGSRTKGAVFRIGHPSARRTVLCEGYATGLSLDCALSRLTGSRCVVVCFSSNNLEIVAKEFPRALVCADNDESGAGQNAASKTGLPWVMPPEAGTDFNDWHQRAGITAVVDILREAPQRLAAE